MLAATDPATAPEAAVAAVLDHATSPMTLAEINESLNGQKMPKKRLLQVVTALVLDGTIFKASRKKGGRSDRYWGRDEEQIIRQHMTSILQVATLTERALLSKVAAATQTDPAPKFLKGSLKTLIAEGHIHLAPPSKKSTAFRLSCQQFEAKDFIPSETIKTLKSLVKKLAPSGFSPDQITDALRKLITPQAISAPGATNGSTIKPSVHQTDSHLSQLREVEQLILKGARDIEPRFTSGTPVSIPDLRAHMPAEYQSKEIFDTAVLRLGSESRLVLHKHDEPYRLSEVERSQLVQDASDNFFVHVSERP